MRRLPGNRFFPRLLPVGIAHIAPGAGLRAALHQPGDHLILYRGWVTGGEKNLRAFFQNSLHQRDHFHIEMHTAGQTHLAEIGQGGDLTQGARHILTGPCDFFL